MKKNVPPARVMMSSTIFRFVYPNRERERERELFWYIADLLDQSE
jgi:hypothetical protein